VLRVQEEVRRFRFEGFARRDFRQRGAQCLEVVPLARLESGALVRVLEDWCQPFPGFFLYYPSRRQLPPALSALIETLRLK
jgi:DNA-binding transcriptional LysR family regulator